MNMINININININMTRLQYRYLVLGGAWGRFPPVPIVAR